MYCCGGKLFGTAGKEEVILGKAVMAICGDDCSYINRMYEYIVSTYGEDFEVVLFTIEKNFEDYLIDHPVEIVIADEDFDIPSKGKINNKIRLSEEPGSDEVIYKYMPCDKILKNIMAICAAGKAAKESVQTDKKKNLIGVYTPVKRCMQTSFAITLGQILAKEHKVLYLNFEGYSGFKAMGYKDDSKDILDLVYFSECSNSNFSYRVKSMKQMIGNLDIISPIESYLKLTEISKEQWVKLIDNLLNKTDYEYVILDLSEQVNGLLSILEKCTKIYTITDSGRISTAKVAQYENLLRINAYEGILNKTEKISIPKFKEIPAEFSQLPYSELARYIKRILKNEDFESGLEY